MLGLLLCVIQIRAQDLKLIVEVENLGTFKGKATTTQIGKRPYTQFFGIPYAKAPVNESRFLVKSYYSVTAFEPQAFLLILISEISQI